MRLSVLKARREAAHKSLEASYLQRADSIQYVGYALGFASLVLIVSLFAVQQRQADAGQAEEGPQGAHQRITGAVQPGRRRA